MKTPRVTDFDPDAKVPTLKSSLDHMPAIEKAKPPTQESPLIKEPERPVQTTTEATPPGTTVLRYHGTGTTVPRYSGTGGETANKTQASV